MNRLLLLATCALLPLGAGAQRTPPSSRCPVIAATCTASLPVFDFGRRPMNADAPAIQATNSVTVTCLRLPTAEGLKIDVDYVLKAVPAEPTRSMRNNDGGYLRYFLFLDAGRTRHWGDGFQFGTFAIEDKLKLDDRNRTVTHTHVLYGTVDAYQIVQPGLQLGLVGARLEYQLACK